MNNGELQPSSRLVPNIVGLTFLLMLALVLYQTLSERGVFLTGAQKEEQRLRELAFEARGLVTRRDIMQEIAQSKHPVATRLLLDIYLNPDIFPGNRTAAITELMHRGDKVSGELSSLLDRDQPLGVRQEVTESLEWVGCDPTCAGQILKYLRNPRKQAFLSPQMREGASAELTEDLRRNHQRMMGDLIDVVMKVTPMSEICSAIADAGDTDVDQQEMARRKNLCASTVATSLQETGARLE
jgi:hypothetical protein